MDGKQELRALSPAPLPQPGEGKENRYIVRKISSEPVATNQTPLPSRSKVQRLDQISSPGSRRGAGERSLLKLAKQLRTEQTDAELKLWYYLRAGRFMGLKFKRQKPIGPYIADFICAEYKLIIECGGSQHCDLYDAMRDGWLTANGYAVLRFWNNHVLHETESVLEQIRLTALLLSKQRTKR